jgi:uncharacterized protein YqeY
MTFNPKMGIMNFMDIKTQLENDLKDAIRASDDVRKSALRMALSAIKLVEIQKGKPLDDAEVIGVLQKEIKSYQETIAESQTANRPDMAASASGQAAILKKYLPTSLTQEELDSLAQESITEAGAASLADMGKVMKILMSKIKGRATGEQASQTVRRLLQ